jgi:hypothetical protein
MDWIQKEIRDLPFATFTLDKALEEVCRLWDESKKKEEEDEEDKDFPKTLKEAFDQWYLEGAVLLGKEERRAIYRALTKEEIGKLKSSVG